MKTRHRFVTLRSPSHTVVLEHTKLYHQLCERDSVFPHKAHIFFRWSPANLKLLIPLLISFLHKKSPKSYFSFAWESDGTVFTLPFEYMLWARLSSLLVCHSPSFSRRTTPTSPQLLWQPSRICQREPSDWLRLPNQRKTLLLVAAEFTTLVKLFFLLYIKREICNI